MHQVCSNFCSRQTLRNSPRCTLSLRELKSLFGHLEVRRFKQCIMMIQLLLLSNAKTKYTTPFLNTKKPRSMNNKTAPSFPSPPLLQRRKKQTQVFGLTVQFSDSGCDCQLWNI